MFSTPAEAITPRSTTVENYDERVESSTLKSVRYSWFEEQQQFKHKLFNPKKTKSHHAKVKIEHIPVSALVGKILLGYHKDVKENINQVEKPKKQFEDYNTEGSHAPTPPDNAYSGGMGKKKKKKDKIPEGTPIEFIDYFAKEKDELTQHAVKVAAELNSVRKLRGDLEMDRDSMIHYYANAVYQLLKVERDIRRAERHLIHVKEMSEDDIGQPISMEPYEKLGMEREGYVTKALDNYREVFKGKQEIDGDRLRAQKEAWERTADEEVTTMKALHRARVREMGRIGETYTQAVLEADKNNREAQEKLFDQMEEEAGRDFRRMILVKNKQLRGKLDKFQRFIEDMKKSYGDLMYNDLNMRYRKMAVKLSDEVSILSYKLSEYKEFYIKHMQTKLSAEKQAMVLVEVEAKQESMESIVQAKKGQLKELEDSCHRLALETNLLEDCSESDKEILHGLWKDCLSEIKKTRLKQMRIWHSMETLTRALQKELKENRELLERFQEQKDNNIELLLNVYKSRHTAKETIRDFSDRALREHYLRVDTLELPAAYVACQEDRFGRNQQDQQAEQPMVPIWKVIDHRPNWDPRLFGINLVPPVLKKKCNRQQVTVH